MITTCWRFKLKVVGYLETDYVGCLDSRKSTSEYIFMLVCGAISWKSEKKRLMAISTLKAECIPML